MKNIQFAMLSVFLLAIAGCGGQKGDKSLLLEDWAEVCVPIGANTFLSLSEALRSKGYGNVKASDMNIALTYTDAVFDESHGSAVIIYSDEFSVPAGTTFTKMRVWQCYETVIRDAQAQGIHINPHVHGKKSYTVSKNAMKNSLGKLPRQEKLPPDIYVKQ